ncbi:MAG: hypothetical protein LBP36_04195 [Oscillospiraceae bacterium]|nr:hypothetical protein [Oscillospiraceae bacterium]
MNKCSRCESELYWKRGFSGRGKRGTRVKSAIIPIIERIWKYSDAHKEALRCHNERIPFKIIERLPHIGHNLFVRWVKEASGQIKKIVSQPQKEGKCDFWKLMNFGIFCSFLFTKKRNPSLYRL